MSISWRDVRTGWLIAALIAAGACGGGDSVSPAPNPVVSVVSVVVTPAAPVIIAGTGVQLSAQLLDAAGNTLTGRVITWSSSNGAIASVSATGLVTGLAAGGPISITATSEGRSGSTAVTILPVPVATVTVSPHASTIALGSSAQLAVVVRDASGTVLVGRAVAWSSSNIAIASVSANGLLTSVAVGGPVTITATSEGVRGTASATVVPTPVATVRITPTSVSVFPGSVAQLTVTTLGADGQPLSGRAVIWSTSNPNVATVTNTGRVTGVAPGTITVSAGSEGITGTASVIVAAIPADLIVTGIRDYNTFVNTCPTSDPAYSIIRQKFEMLNETVPTSVVVTCTAPFNTIPTDQLTDELIAMQTMRLIYYLSQGSAGKLPWTPLGLFEWVTSEIAGVSFTSQPGNSACCLSINGKKYIITSRKPAAQRDFYRDWSAIFGWAALYSHEARHVSGPGHVNGCLAFPLSTDPFGCDAAYNLSNIGSYGVQYWLYSNLAKGLLNVGVGCASPATAQSYVNAQADFANAYLGRFVASPPPSVSATVPYGGPCFP